MLPNRAPKNTFTQKNRRPGDMQVSGLRQNDCLTEQQMLYRYFRSPDSGLARIGSTLVLALAIAAGARAQSSKEAATSLDPFELTTVRLWEGNAPGAKGDGPKDR